jgi:hypothetical protein
MKLQKIILCVAAGATAFGASLGLLEIGRWVGAALEPLRVEIKMREANALPVVFPAPQIKPLILTFQPSEQTAEPIAEPDIEHDSGEYYIIGVPPKGFIEIDFIEILTVEYDEKKRRLFPIEPTGHLQTAREFKFSRINITGKRVTFVTAERNGISYQFDGKFIPEEKVKYKSADGGEYSDYANLKGRLTKWRGGVKIAEAKVKLSKFQGC